MWQADLKVASIIITALHNSFHPKCGQELLLASNIDDGKGDGLSLLCLFTLYETQAC